MNCSTLINEGHGVIFDVVSNRQPVCFAALFVWCWPELVGLALLALCLLLSRRVPRLLFCLPQLMLPAFVLAGRVCQTEDGSESVRSLFVLVVRLHPCWPDRLIPAVCLLLLCGEQGRRKEGCAREEKAMSVLLANDAICSFPSAAMIKHANAINAQRRHSCIQHTQTGPPDGNHEFSRKQ
jgi:hypothetical protein